VVVNPSNPHEAWLALTPAMRDMLTLAALRPVGPWDWGSSTVGALKRCGYIKGTKIKETVLGHTSTKTVYDATEAGRRALEGGVP
jgi:hypothetical protein